MPVQITVPALIPVTSSITVTTIVANAAAVQVVATNAAARTRTLFNTGAGDAYFGFSNAVTAATGILVQAGGGGFDWPAGTVDPRAIFVFSPAGTTIRVLEGT